MIKRLRKKFIMITMLSVTTVLVVIMSIVNIINYISLERESDILLDVLSANGGIFPKPDKPKNDKPSMDSPIGTPHFEADDGINDYRGQIGQPGQKSITEETPYRTRYFTAQLRNDGTVIAVNTGNIAAVRTEDAEIYAADVYSIGKNDGYYGIYKYRVVKNDKGNMIIFLDCSEHRATFKSFLLISVMVSLSGIVAVLLLVVIFSKIAVKPYAESYNKQKRFITDASHELKTPLTVIGANADVLELESGENNWTKSIKEQVEKLSVLTASLVTLSRMDEEDSRLVMTDFSLSDAVSESIAPFVLPIEAAGKHITTDIEANMTYHGNEKALRMLISILAENALKYSDEGGEISVTLKKCGNGCEIMFCNSVENIEKGNLGMYFERFYRADSSRNSETGGNGIGLSIAKAIINAHKGKIGARSDDGKSFVVTVKL